MDRAAIEVRDLNRVGRICEIDKRHSALVPGLREDIATGHRHNRAVVRYAIFFLVLRCRQLVVAAELELAVNDVVNRVGAPGNRVISSATRTATATPLVRKDHFRTVIIERSRMPVGESRIDDFVHARRIERIRNVEDDAVARARPASDSQRREYRDVVALVGHTGFLRFIAMVAALPQAGKPAGLLIGKNRGAGDDARPVRCGNRNLDDIDAEQRRALIR